MFAVVAVVHCSQRVLFCSWTRRRSREHWKFDPANSAPRYTSRRTLLPIWHIIIFLYAPCVFWGKSPQKLSNLCRLFREEPLLDLYKSFARKNPLSLPSPFCIRFVSVFFHPKLHVCKQDLWCLEWPHARTRIQQHVGLTKFSWPFCKIEAPQSSSGTELFWHTSLFPLCKNFIPLLWSAGEWHVC